jgi:outer membrane protein assembly factor BamB
MKRLALFPLFLLLGIFTSLASGDPIWKQNFDKGVDWTRLASNGILLVGTSDWGLHGVDVTTGQLLWSNEKLYNSAKGLKGADGKKQEYNESLIQILEKDGSPGTSNFALVRYTDDIMIKNMVLINIKTGEMIINPESAGMPVLRMLGKEDVYFNYYGSGYMADLNAVIISGDGKDPKTGKDFTITKYVSLPDGKVLWENNDIASKMLPVATEDGNMLMVGEKTIAKLDPKTGKMLWSKDVEDKKLSWEAFDVNITLTTGYFYQKKGSNGLLSAIDLASGNNLWEKELSTKKAPELTATSFGVIVADDKDFNLFDASSGNVKWTAKKLSGLVVDLGGNRGIAIAEKDKYLTVLDKDTGAEKWSQKVKGIQIDQITGAGIMYWDDKRQLGLIDFDGKDIWTGKDKLNGEGILRARPSLETELFYSDEKVVKVNLITGEKKVIIDKVKFEEKETPDNLEFVGSGFVLSSSQNMWGFDENGKVFYQQHWASPKISLAGRIALRTMSVATTMMAAAAAVRAGDAYGNSGFGGMGGTSVQQRQLAAQAESFSNMSSAFSQAANQRFKASKARGDYNLILTDVDGNIGLRQIDRATGKEMGNFVLNDKNPVYEFDPVQGTIFYKPSKKEVFCYTMN